MLIRPRAWWYNKVPVTLAFLVILADGRSLTLGSAFVLLVVILAVCAVANFGYALNEIYDIREDAAIGRINAAAAMGVRRVAAIAVLSAALAEILSWGAGGPAGGLLTLAELCLPIAYSYPAFRLKEKKWLGVLADATAAHVYPAVLALQAVTYADLRPVSAILLFLVLGWSLATGLRGILSHQLKTAEQDTAGGLSTVVHQFGRISLIRFVVVVLTPIEVMSMGAILIACGVGVLGWAAVLVYLAYEAAKQSSGRFIVVAFRPEGEPYIPFVQDGFYKAWGPMLLPLDAARHHPVWLAFIPVYYLLFRPLVKAEQAQLSALVRPVLAAREEGAMKPKERA